MFIITAAITEQTAYARAGGGRSFGGSSRSFSRPYSSPSRQSTQPYSQPYSTPSGGMLRGLGAGLAGGFLGSLLFRGMGYGSTGMGGGGGIGLLDILVIGGVGLMVYRMFKRRQEGGSGGLFSGMGGGLFGSGSSSANNQEAGLAGIKAGDPSFDEVRFKDNVMDMFFSIQAAWMNRDLSTIKSLLSDDMREFFQEDIDALLKSGKINKLENIAVRTVDITEAWQETGQDFITTLIYANILDYTIDEKSGDIIKGSKTEPTKFEEYWTFMRNSGSKKWMLAGINQA